MIFNQSYSLNNQSACTSLPKYCLRTLISTSLPSPLPKFSSLSSSLSPSVDYHKFYLRATDNHSVSNSSNKPVHMYPQLLEGEINSGLHRYVARQAGRQTQTGRHKQVDRQTGRQMDHLHFHVSVLQSDSSVRSQREEVTDAVVERHTGGKRNTCKHNSKHTGGIN